MPGFYTRYPKADSSGIPNDRVEIRRVSNGAISYGIDDGYDVVEGEVTPHNALAQLIKQLSKKQVDPATGEMVPVFVLAKPHKFATRGGGQHPLAAYNTVYGPSHDKARENFDAEKKLRAHAVKEEADKVVADVKARDEARSARKAKGE